MTATTTDPPSTSPVQSLAMMMRALKLPAFARYAEEIAQKAEREGWTFGQYLHHLAELEIHEVNFIHGGNPDDTRATSGTVTLTSYMKGASVDGTIDVKFPTGSAKGTFHATWCPGGHEH
jgi:hypothetical protein